MGRGHRNLVLSLNDYEPLIKVLSLFPYPMNRLGQQRGSDETVGVKASRKRHLCTVGERHTSPPDAWRTEGAGLGTQKLRLNSQAGGAQVSFVQVSRPRDRRGGREAAGRPLQLDPQHGHAHVRARTPSQPWASGSSRRGLCRVNNALPYPALCTVTLQHLLLLKTFPWVFRAEALCSVHGGQHEA